MGYRLNFGIACSHYAETQISGGTVAAMTLRKDFQKLGDSSELQYPAKPKEWPIRKSDDVKRLVLGPLCMFTASLQNHDHHDICAVTLEGSDSLILYYSLHWYVIYLICV